MAKTYGIKTRGIVYRKTDGHCAYCGRWLDPFEGWHIEHMKPKSNGGADKIDNMVPACHDCNRRKRNRDIEEFRTWILGSIANQAEEKWIPKLEFAACMIGSERADQLIANIRTLVQEFEQEPIIFYLDKMKGNTP